MADALEALVAQTLVAKIVSGYVRKNLLAPAGLGADRHRLPIIVGAYADGSLGAGANPRRPDPPISYAELRRVPRMWLARGDATSPSSKQAWTGPPRVSSQMGAARETSAGGTGLLLEQRVISTR